MGFLRLPLLTIMACLLLATPLALASCEGGLSQEQRENYLQMAVDYEKRASEAEKQAKEWWDASLKIPPSSQYKIEIRNSAEAQAKRYDDMAKEYRQQALRYRELAAK